MSIDFFYSDPHFGHANIIEYCQRPFTDVEQMNTELVRRYNAVVQPGDVVLWCGDCFFKGDPARAKNILAEMAGTKLLVVGNHDKSPTAMAEMGFSLVLREGVLNIAGRTCRVNHFPYAPDPKYERPDRFKELRPRRVPGEILLHGHTHSKNRVNGNQINLSIDAWEYGPASFGQIDALVRGI